MPRKVKGRIDSDAIRDFEEEIGRDPDFALQSEAISREIDSRGREHAIAAEKLAQKHKIPVSARQDHLRLLAELRSVMTRPSGVDLSPEKWTIPSDLPGWKTTKEQLEAIALGSDRLLRQIDNALSNVTLVAAIEMVDVSERFADGLAGLREAAEILAAAASIQKPANAKGKRGGGRRRNPRWVGKFVEVAQEFWVTHMRGGTKPKFHSYETSAGATAFTRWIVDVYRCLTVPSDQNLPMFRTELERLDALHRPSKS